MRRRITRDIDAQRAGQHPIHPRVGGEDGTLRLEPLTQLGLQVAGDSDHDRRGVAACQMIDQLQLLFWPQRGLQDNHLVAVPGAGPGLRRTERVDRNSDPPGSRPQALREQEFVLDQEQRPRHRCRIAPDREAGLLVDAKRAFALAIIAPGESWVEGYGSLRRNL